MAKNILIFILITLIVFLTKANIINLPYHWDELGAFMRPAYWLANSGLINFIPGFHPPEMFFGHPPALYLSFATVLRIFGESPAVAHAFLLMIVSVGLWYTYLLGAYLHSEIAGLIAVSLLFLSPLFFAQSGMVTCDIVLATLSVMSVYHALRGQYARYLVAATIMLLVKESSIAVVVSVLAYLFIVDSANRKARMIFKYALPTIPFVLFFIAQKITTGTFLPNAYFNDHAFAVYDLEMIINKAIAVLWWTLYDQYRFLLVALIVLNFLIYRKRAIKKEYLLFFFLFVSFCTAFTFIYFLPRYNLPILPFFYIMASISLVTLVRSKLVASAVASLIIAIFATNLYNADGRCTSGENTMHYVNIVKSHKMAADFISENYSDKIALVTFPMTVELTNHKFGYVKKNIRIVGYDYKRPITERFDIIVYSPQSDGSANQGLRELAELKGFTSVGKFEKDGNFTEVFMPQERR